MGISVFIGGISMDPKVYIQFPVHSFFGLEFYVFLAFGGYFFLVCSFLLFPGILISDSKSYFGLNGLSRVLILLSIESIVYALLLDVIPSLTALFPWHGSFDYLIWGIFLFILGFPPLVFKERFNANNNAQSLVFVICLFVGFIFLGFSWLEYSYLLFPSLSRRLWGVHFILGSLFLISGGLPLSVSYMAKKSTFLTKLDPLFLLIALLGGIIYLMPTIIHNGFLPLEILRSFHYFELLTFGLLIMSLGLVPFSISETRTKTIYKYKNHLLAILIIGVIQIGIAGLLVMLTGPIQSSAAFNPSIFYMTWDVWWFNGVAATSLSLIFLIPLLFFQTQNFGVEPFGEAEGERQSPSSETNA